MCSSSKCFFSKWEWPPPTRKHPTLPAGKWPGSEVPFRSSKHAKAGDKKKTCFWKIYENLPKMNQNYINIDLFRYHVWLSESKVHDQGMKWGNSTGGLNDTYGPVPGHVTTDSLFVWLWLKIWYQWNHKNWVFIYYPVRIPIKDGILSIKM